MAYKSYTLYFVCQGDPDVLAELKIDEEILDRYGKDGCLDIGGAWNGSYSLGQTWFQDEDGDFEGFNEANYDSGLDDIVEIIGRIQKHMNHDGGNFIYAKWLRSFQKKVSPAQFEGVIKNLSHPIQEYTGGQPVDKEEFLTLA